jgi:hypothetical protein
MKKTNKTRRSLLSDVRGASEFTQAIILTVALALGGLVAVGALKTAIENKANTTATAIEGIQ